LLRLLLLRMGAQDHLLLVTMHHIVSDAWSNGILIQEVAALYQAFSRGGASPLPELPVQYADFAVWQRAWLQGEVLQEQLSWWRQHLAGAPQVLDLATDRPRPALQTSRGARVPVPLPRALALEVRQLCRQEGATSFMVLLAAWAALLGRYSGQLEVLVGSPIANRNRREIEELIGFFANTLVLRSDLSGRPSFRELLARVRGVALEAFNHQDLPFERLVEELAPERDLSRSPLFQAMLAVQNVAGADLAVPGLTLAPILVDSASAKFDLLLHLAEARDGGLDGLLEYNADLFDVDRMARLAQHFQALLAGAAADPSRPVPTLPLLAEEERARLLFEWNDNAVATPRLCVHEPVERQAERTPDGLAAVWAEDGSGLTYRDLNRRANQLAHHLRSLGVGPDERVSICLERSLDPLIAVLGVLKAGGVYVPIDPEYPADRVALLLADSRSRVLVTTLDVAARLPGLDREQGPRLVLLDSHQEALAAGRADDPEPRTTPDHLAYVIYTSGSTGRPKGVAMPHGALANLLAWQRTASAAGVGSRTLQLASLSFDVSFQEIFSSWWTGGTVVAVAQETRRDARLLCQALRDLEVERLFLPFVALQQMADVIERGAPVPTALREIVTAGEQLQITRPIAAWLERSDAFLENQYGPSEGHVVTAHRLSGPPGQWPDLPPIGRPLPNVRTYLLDRDFEPVPQGVPGHLCFGGAQVVRGYLDRPELTAERFIPDPFSREPGGRLYATGDQARYLAGGTLRFLGRIDQQVKIRGFRVEPGEVESALARHPGVREAAVVVHGDGARRRLVGYYVAEAALAGDELRAFLAGELPEYMVPASLVRLEALPLTPSGKLDRQSLPAPQATEETGYVAPEIPAEEQLAGIWAEVLGIDRIGAHDDFFALGGQSLLATQMVSRIRDVLGVELPLRRVFETPTLRGLARSLRPEAAGESPPAAENIAWAVRVSGELSIPDLEQTLAEVVRRQTKASPDAGQPGLCALDLSAAPEEAREEWRRELAAEESRHPFDPRNPSSLRLGLLRLAEREHLLLVTAPPLLLDGWSLGSLLREIEALYPQQPGLTLAEVS
jgi:amino acid adenylation domain-containing protein